MDRQAEKKLILWERVLWYDALVIGLLAVALIAGWGLKSWAEARATAFTALDANLSLSYPDSWTLQSEKGTLLSIRDLRSPGTFKATFSVEVRELDPAVSKPIQVLAELFAKEREQELNAYRVLATSASEVDGLEAVRISYAYEDEPTEGRFQKSLPVVVEGVDVLVIHGSNLYIFSFAAPTSTFSEEVETLDAILDSVNLEE